LGSFSLDLLFREVTFVTGGKMKKAKKSVTASGAREVKATKKLPKLPLLPPKPSIYRRRITGEVFW
jgi:hypothetical protein